MELWHHLGIQTLRHLSTSNILLFLILFYPTPFFPDSAVLRLFLPKPSAGKFIYGFFASLRVSHEHPLSSQLLWKHFSGTDWVLNFSCHCPQILAQCQAPGSQHGIEQPSSTQPGPKPSCQLHLLLFTHCAPTDLSYLPFLVHSLCFLGFCSLKYHSLVSLQAQILSSHPGKIICSVLQDIFPLILHP